MSRTWCLLLGFNINVNYEAKQTKSAKKVVNHFSVYSLHIEPTITSEEKQAAKNLL